MNLQNETIAFIGAGNMAEALVRGLLTAHTVAPRQIVVTDVRAERLNYFVTTFGVTTAPDNTAAASRAGIIVLAVKPQQMGAVLTGLRATVAKHLIISIAAGVTTVRIERELGGQPRVVRVMPNTPALVGAGAAAISRGAHATEDDLATTEAILKAVGISVRVEESLMNAVTALSGSGPAYVFYMTEALIAAGKEAGLTEELAQKLAVQTVFGAAAMVAATGESPVSLREKVTSPGGTTEAALKVMTDRQLSAIYIEAVKAAKRRGEELAG